MNWNVASLLAYLDRLIWRTPVEKLPRAQEWGVHFMRLVLVLACHRSLPPSLAAARRRPLCANRTPGGRPLPSARTRIAKAWSA